MSGQKTTETALSRYARLVAYKMRGEAGVYSSLMSLRHDPAALGYEAMMLAAFYAHKEHFADMLRKLDGMCMAAQSGAGPHEGNPI